MLSSLFCTRRVLQVINVERDVFAYQIRLERIEGRHGGFYIIGLRIVFSSQRAEHGISCSAHILSQGCLGGDVNGDGNDIYRIG